MLSYKLLNAKADSYIDFLNRAANGESAYFKQEIPKLFAKDCHKIGHVGKISRSCFEGYFLKGQTELGKWRIQKLASYPCEEHSTVSIKYLAETEKSTYLVIALLKINTEELIEDIVETDCCAREDLLTFLKNQAAQQPG